MESVLPKILKENKKPSKSKIIRSTALAKQYQRRLEIYDRLGRGYTVWQIANELDVDDKTVRRDMEWLFSQVNMEEEGNKMLASIDFALARASERMNSGELEEQERIQWTNTFNQILRTKALYMKKNVTIVDKQVNIQNNTQINNKIDINQFIDALHGRVIDGTTKKDNEDES